MDPQHWPWYVKAFLALGGTTMIWKAVQGSIPKLLGYLTPLALKSADALTVLALANPLARWLLLGNLQNTHATINALCDGLEQLIDTVQARINANLSAAAGVVDGKKAPPVA